ncbi:hypothetical protein KVR01_001822 [Diaporthe batatas]|uniref:uncharacterized protein n=1 Tax=Diaporthe batatas TaxID=748121 RepID=UPI001D05365E|nr:uncharacterized protein KVR01_001822 [Diaporthe batatas]KAG8169073.1 hypothetical protein KVR01_001822 [Diaporthe batatas]
MPPTIILIRHAQALHNVDKNYEIPDPELSELGRQQCQQLKENLREKLPKDLDVGLILVSPMRRTCETAMLALGDWAAERGIPIEANADWQENSAKPCDTGSPVAAVAAEFPAIDFSRVDPAYPDKTSPAGERYWYTRQHLLERAQSCLRDLRARPEKAVVVVSHSGFMRLALTGDWYFNADYRIYEFAEEEGGAGTGKLALKQWDLTRAGHGGMGWSFDEVCELGSGLPEHALPPGEEEPLPAGLRPN